MDTDSGRFEPDAFAESFCYRREVDIVQTQAAVV